MQNILITATMVCLTTFAGCDKQTLTKQYERLPELPQAIATTLDAKRMATKIPIPDFTPVKDPTITTAPCCSITDRMELLVKYPYTKCGPLRDFIVAPMADRVVMLGRTSLSSNARGIQGSNVGDLKAFKLTTLNGQTVLDQHVCVRSSGPWKATLTIERRCNGYMPINSLLIDAFGDPVPLGWSGGTQNHPPDVQLVSCRTLGTSGSQCGALSSCPCTNSTCPPTSSCDCNLAW